MPRCLASQSFVDGTFPPAGAAPQLASAWEAIVRDETLRWPLDHPGRLLSAYFRQRRRSSLGDSVSLANVLGETCDTVFVVAGREEIASCEALVAAAAHPLHNLLRANQRGGRPRVIYLEPTLDTDLLQGAIDLVRRVGEGTDLHTRWAVALIAPATRDDTQLRRDLREAAAPLASALRESSSGAVDLQARLIVLDESAEQAAELVAPGLAFHTLALERCSSLLDGPALFLSALVGADSISQLKGAVWFWEAAKCRLAHESNVVALADLLSRPGCRIATWLHALESLARRLADGRLIPVVPAYAHAGRRELAASTDGPTLHLWSETVRRDPLRGLRDQEDVPEFVAEALRAEYLASRPEAEMRIRRLNDIAIGELCQWFSAARLLLAIAEK